MKPEEKEKKKKIVDEDEVDPNIDPDEVVWDEDEEDWEPECDGTWKDKDD